MRFMNLCSWICYLLIFGGSFYLGVLFPNRNGEITLSYVNGTANVHYGEDGVPHIFADNQEMGSLALGYVHAADRLWHMDYMRRLAQGKLSEIFGNVTVPVDESMRLLNIRNT